MFRKKKAEKKIKKEKGCKKCGGSGLEAPEVTCKDCNGRGVK